MDDTAFSILDIKKIEESKANTRQHFGEKEQAELAESIKAKGIVSPLLVRRVNSHFEIVDGARRLRAAKAAGLDQIPAIVRELSDDEAAELGVVANLQRQDVHPLDEAEGYKRLLATKRYDVAALAAKMGKSSSYVHQRLALNSLIPEAKKAFWADTLTVAHGGLLARLQPDDQREIFKDMTRYSESPWPITRLRRHIEEQVMCTLDSAAFDKKDPLLAAKAGACTVCPKRSGFNKELFNDITTKDRCTDPACFNAKCEAHIARIESQARANSAKTVRISDDVYPSNKKLVPRAGKYSDRGGWRPAKKGCPSPLAGILVEGEGAGKVMQVCTNITCKTCNPGGKKDPFGRSKSKSVTPAARYKRRMEIWNNKVEQAARQICYSQLVGQIDRELDRTQLLMILREVRERGHGGEDVAARLVSVKLPKKDWQNASTVASWEKAMKHVAEAKLVQLLFAMLLQREMIVDPSARTPSGECFKALSDQYGEGMAVLSTARVKAREQLMKSAPKPPKAEKKPAEKKSKKEVKKHG